MHRQGALSIPLAISADKPLDRSRCETSSEWFLQHAAIALQQKASACIEATGSLCNRRAHGRHQARCGTADRQANPLRRAMVSFSAFLAMRVVLYSTSKSPMLSLFVFLSLLSLSGPLSLSVSACKPRHVQ